MNIRKTLVVRRVAGLLLLVGLLTLPCHAVAAPFAVYGISQNEIDSPNTGSLATRYVPGPFVWRDFGLPPLEGWDERVTLEYNYVVGEFTLDADNVISSPITSHSLITAHDDLGNPIGELEIEGQGTYYINLDAADAIVDEIGGLILLRAGGEGALPGLLETNVVTRSTGVFQDQVSVNDRLATHISGYSPRDLIPGMPLQDNIFNARLHGFLSEFAIVSIPEPSGGVLGLLAATGAGLGVRRRRAS
jgi:hypothetical protein